MPFDFDRKLGVLMVERGIKSNEQLSRLTGISRQSISNLRNTPNANPRLQTIEVIAQALEISPPKFLEACWVEQS